MRTLIITLVSALVLLCACNGHRTPNSRSEVEISGLSDSLWTYFSFESGAVVGQSDYLDAEQDASWAGRGDWDFAVCGDYIKTNGGTSGGGLAGVLVDKSSTFDALLEAPEGGYIVDTLFVAK